MDRARLKSLLRATGCAVERGDFVFLQDPQLGADLPAVPVTSPTPEHPDRGWLAIRTGGSSGAAKHARHDEHTLTAAVRGFCAHFRISRVNAVDVLPAFHVSGLMARVRCAETGGAHLAWDWKKLEAGVPPALPAGEWVISLVPTQLQRLLRVPAMVAWLREFRAIFVGGGPVWAALADAAARAGLPVSICYGMTETAAMVTALRPEEFLAGERSCGEALPHARITVAAEDTIRVEGESVFRGYWPECGGANAFVTEDLGALDARGRLHVFGRRDGVIISGGKKIHAADVEAALRASGEFEDVVVMGVPDAEWGEAVVAFFPTEGGGPDLARAASALAAHERPKRFVPVPRAEWPRNEQGKVNRAELRRRW